MVLYTDFVAHHVMCFQSCSFMLLGTAIIFETAVFSTEPEFVVQYMKLYSFNSERQFSVLRKSLIKTLSLKVVKHRIKASETVNQYIFSM